MAGTPLQFDGFRSLACGLLVALTIGGLVARSAIAQPPPLPQESAATEIPVAPQPIPAAAAIPAAQELSIEHFQVATLLDRLGREVGLRDAAANEWVYQHVRSLIQLNASATQSTSAIGVQFADGHQARMPLSENGKGCLLHGSELIATGSEEDLQLIRNALATLEESGIRQILIRTYVFRAPEAEIRRLPIRWSYVENVSTVAENADSAVKPATHSTAFPAQSGVSVAAHYMARQRELEADALAPPRGVTTPTWTEASAIIERSTPVLYTLLTPQESKQVVSEATRGDAIEKVMSPAVVVFNGHSASINNTVERPFVTGVKPIRVGQDENEQVQFAPNIRVYPEGTTLTLLPQLIDGRQVRLNCKLKLCKIRKVETLDIPRADEDGEKFTVQMPEVASTQFHTCLDLPLDFALAVSTSDTDEQGVKTTTLVICQCSARDMQGRVAQPAAAQP